MSELPEERKRGRWARNIATFLVLLALYVLSYAPAVRYDLDRRRYIRDFPVYAPVEWLMDKTPAALPLAWWATLWDVQAPIEFRAQFRNQ